MQGGKMTRKKKTIYLEEDLLKESIGFANSKCRSFTWIAEQAIRKYIGYKQKKG
jgi:predicted transcriptional regulator